MSLIQVNDHRKPSLSQVMRNSALFPEQPEAEFETQKTFFGDLPARHKSEKLLLACVTLASVLLWTILSISVIGIAYALFFGLIGYLTQIVFVTYLRGSAVKVSETQFPELHERFCLIASRLKLETLPEFYITNSDGALNAFATRFRGANMVVIFSELLDACGDNADARDFILGHELAHVKAGHLKWWLFRSLGEMIPFLGSAYSRAREYTCDRWGYWSVGRTKDAQLGLVVLAIGGKLAPKVNLTSFLAQRQDLDTGLMTIGRWLSGYPVLSERVAALDSSRFGENLYSNKSRGLALALCAAMVLVPVLGFTSLVAAIASERQAAKEQSAFESSSEDESADESLALDESDELADDEQYEAEE